MSRTARSVMFFTALLALGGPSAASASTAPPTEPPEGDVDMAGNPIEAEPVVLTATVGANIERWGGQPMQRFAEELEQVSGGAITLELTTDSPDPLGQFVDGDVDITLARASAFEAVGVDTLEVLTMPFVVQDDDQADRVASREVAGDLMSGLSSIGATGLMLAPTAQLHFSFADGHSDGGGQHDSLRSIDQLQTGVRSIHPSATVEALFGAIGAHAVYDLNNEDWDAAIGSGEVNVSLLPTYSMISPHGYLATNFTWFYDFSVIAIRDEALDGLDDSQRALVHQAADAALQRQIDERLREDEAFDQACSEGGVLTAAPMSLIADIGFAVDDVILDLLADPAQRELYDAVRTAAGLNKVPDPRECSASDITDYVPPDPPSTEFPEGVFRAVDGTPDELYVRGVPPTDARNNSGDYWEWTFADGKASLQRYRDDAPTPADITDVPYTIDETGRLLIDGWWPFTWSETPDGIVLEAIPNYDDDEERWGDWELSMYGINRLVRTN